MCDSGRFWLVVGLTSMAGVLLAAASAIPRGQQDPSTEICRHVRADGGQSTQFDAGSLAESYDRFKREFGRKLDVAIEKSKRLVDSPVDVGLPFCRFPRTMSRKLASALPVKHRSKKVLVVSADEPAELRRLVVLHKDALVLVAKARRIGDTADLALEKPAGIATPELAKALGVACLPTLVVINPEGDRLELRERP